MDIDELLTQIEEEVANGKKTIFGGNVTVNGDFVLSLIQKIRENLPDIIKEAKYIVSTSEKRRADDTRKGQNILITAQERADELLSEHSIVSGAEQKADAILRQANDYKNRILSDAHGQIFDTISEAERSLIDALNFLNSMKEEL